ncbi:MAG: hypothetical protein ACR2PL_01415 [Dehalococcoidia bacterium]
MPRLVVTLDEGSEQALLGQPALGVAPTSLDLAYASDCDLLVPEEESPLGYPFMIEVWNEVQVLQEQLGRYLGTLPQPFKRYLGLLHEAQFGIEVDLSPLIPHIGPPITHRDDPRFAFQEDEHEACEYLGLPVMSALGESEDSEASEPARTVRSLLHKHVPSGFPELDSTTTPLTVGDVAARLQSDHAAGRPIPSVDRLTNQRLLRNGIAVSRPVTAAVVAQLKELLHVEGSDRYWEVFRQAAVKLGMARQQGQIQLVAARRQQQGYRRTPARRSRKHPERQEE